MGQFKIGNLSLSNVYLGENSINKIYFGTTLLYQKKEPTIWGFYRGEDTSSYFNQKIEEQQNKTEDKHSLLYWNFTKSTYVLNPKHIAESISDNTYIYELYYTNGFSSGTLNCISVEPFSSQYVCCVRYRKNELRENNSTDIYMHNMLLSDFRGVFYSDVSSSRIYSWHEGQDYCTAYYWYNYMN